MGFAHTVNTQGAPAVRGDFADHNSARTTVDAGPGAFVVGADGVNVGSFVWADADNRAVNNFGTGPVTGVIHRDQQAIITTYLEDATLRMYPGYQATVFNGGSFWMLNEGSTTAVVGNKAYANFNDGSVSFNVTGTPPTSGSATGATVAKIVSASTGGALPTTNTSTGSISGTTLTVTAVGSGSVLGAGQTISGGNSSTGVIVPNTTIIAQVSGTAGGIGMYTVNVSQSITSTAISMSGGGLTLTGGNTSGIFAIGQTISGTNIPAGTTITGYGTATAGGAGTYTVSNPAVTAATASTITAANAMFLTVDGSSTGTWALHDLLVGAGIPTSGTLSYISATHAENANVTGVGGAGTYLVTGFYTAVSAETITVNSGVETKWIAQSVGAPGELVKMSSFLLG